MSQQVDDMTGKPIEPVKMSATDREKQRIEMVSTINAMILQMNALTAAVSELRVQQIPSIAHDVERLHRHQARQAASFKARLVWLVKGR